MDPLISVIVPVYKVEPYLRQCVDSILDQTYANLEVILVDDGSPDSCGAICDEYAVKDRRVKVIHKGNGGLSDARNVGLNAAAGDYITFVDSDDWLDKFAVGIMYQTMIETKADLVIGKHDRIEDETGECLWQPERAEAVKLMSSEDAMRQMFQTGCAAWARLYKKDIHSGVTFPVGEINEDEAIVLRLLERCGKVAEISRVVYHYRCRPESITTASFSAKKLIWVSHCRSNLAYVQERYPELELDAAARYRGSILWALTEMVRSDGFEAEIQNLQKELWEKRYLLKKAPFDARTDRLRMLLLLYLPFPVYRWIIRKRRGLLEI